MRLVPGHRPAFGWASALLLGGALHPSPVSAQEQDHTRRNAVFELEWSAPAGCPTREWILGRVQGVEESSRFLRARATVTAVPVGFELDLVTTQAGRKGRRKLSAATCEELAEATAVLLSLSLNEAARPQGRVPPAPVPSAPQASQSPEATPGAPSSVQLAAGARATVLVLPRLAAGPLFSISYGREHTDFEFAAFALLPSESSGEDGKGGSFSSYALRLGACRRWGDALQIGGCLGLLFGATHGVGLGVDEPLRVWAPRLSPELRLPLSLRTDGIVASLSVGGGIHFVRPTFSLEPTGTFFQPAPAYGALEITIGRLF